MGDAMAAPPSGEDTRFVDFKMPSTAPPSPDERSSPEQADAKSLEENDVKITPRRQRWKSAFSPWDAKPIQVLEILPTGTDCSSDENKREPLRAIAVQGREDVPPVALATPFLPGISGGIWSTPAWNPSPPLGNDVADKDTEIRLLHEKVRRLALEKDMAVNDNARLLGEVHHLSAIVRGAHRMGSEQLPERSFPSPPAMLPRGFLSHPSSPILETPFQSITPTLLDQHAAAPAATPDLEPGAYRPSQMTVDLILSGKLDYLRMDPRSEYDLIRPLVWTIAHHEPKSSAQAATLKIAANALGSRLGSPRPLALTQYLVSVISEWAKPLCFTSNGNYLCQQLLEKGTVEDKLNFIQVIEHEIVAIANNKFGAHVLVKAVGVKELESRIADALIKYGIYESMQTGARKVWRPYLGKCRTANESFIFEQIMSDMKGRWVDLAVSNENGSISVQQIFEGCANQELIVSPLLSAADAKDACFKEILEDISRVANNQFGHFVVNKLLNFQEPMIKAVSHAILTAYPPLATNHHGVQFVEYVISANRILQGTNIVKYLDSLCSQKEGRTPAIVAVANSSVGRGHLQTVLRQVPPGERVLMSRVHNTCRQFQTTLRNSQSGNELLRSLGIINTPARRTSA